MKGHIDEEDELTRTFECNRLRQARRGVRLRMEMVGTLDFQWPLPQQSAESFLSFVAQYEKRSGTSFSELVRLVEHGRWDKEIRIHVLLGGSLFSFKEYWILYWWDWEVARP